jgi:glycosyltransferase involved in cell wall biosynthesis
LNYAEKNISILFVIDGLEFGGGERVFLQLATGLKNRYRVSVATNTNGRFAYELARLGIELFSVNMSKKLTLKPIRQIRDIIRDNNIDLVHSQGARADFFARLAGRMAKVSNILCTIAMPVEGFEVGRLRKTMYRFLDWLSERYVKKFIVVSDSLREALTEGRGIPSQSVVKIYNGIELDHYQPDLNETTLRSQWAIPPSAPLVGAIGRMVWQKGFNYFIKAIPELLQVEPSARFVVVGEGPLKEDLEVLAHDLDVKDHVIFPGFTRRIREALASMDVLVVPSVLEGFPIVTLEAMAMGKPIVATNIHGITEQISDSKEGILVPPEDPKALTTAILRLLHDKELSARLGLAALTKVERCFSIDTMVSETEKVYLSLLKLQYSAM